MKSSTVTLDSHHLAAIVSALELLASGDTSIRVPLSHRRDELDAIALGINVLAGELSHAMSKLVQTAKINTLAEVGAGIAHEIKNPLTLVLSATEGLETLLHGREMIRSDQLAPIVQKLNQGVSRMSRVVNHVAEFTSHSRSEVSVVRLNPVVEQTLVFMTEHFKLKGVILETSLTKRDLRVMVDPLRFEQILINLLMNALASVAGGEKEQGWVKISTRAEPPEAVIQVVDNGQGIPDEIRERIFDPFFTTRASSSGNGLGLAICRSILRELKGTLECAPPLASSGIGPGLGAVFTVRVPLVKES